MADFVVVNENAKDNEIVKKLKVKGGHLFFHVMKWKNDNGWLRTSSMCFVPGEDDTP